ncbi:MAG TPA: cellulase family glycosylhydrolase [Chitinophagaceae bacterium]
MCSRFFFFFLFCFASSGYSQGFLKADGKIIVDGNGQKYILRGMGLGGWMLQEGYMFHVSNLGRQYIIKSKIEELVGTEKTNLFYQQWLAGHTTKADIDSLAAWGFNSIRLPMHYNLFTLPVDQEPVKGGETWIGKGFTMVDSLLKWCGHNKMYLILDLHATPGGQGNDLPISDRDPAKPSLWESEANQQKMVALWHELAWRYANEPWIGGYDIINEPNWGFDDPKDIRGTKEQLNEPLKKLMVRITNAIREVDTHHIIIIEGNGFGNNYNGLLPTWDNNMVLSFHKYGNFNQPSAIAHFLELREKYNVPLWMGESGENSNTWFTEAINLVETHDIGWAWWQSKKMGINNPLEVKEPEGYHLLTDYWMGKGPKPSEAEAWAILQQWLANMQIRNNIVHPDVMDAMFRQVYSTDTKPFKQHIAGKGSTLINAVDYDMGRQGYAYYDKDTASYQYTPGVKTVGNRGHAYRNDGVDIEGSKAGYYVFSIEDGEWMQYTVNVQETGEYSIAFKTASDNAEGKLSLLADNAILVKELPVPDSKGLTNWQSVEVKHIHLSKGIHKLRVYADKGGFNLLSFSISK